MICPKCGRPVPERAVICTGCDFILDTEFLGDEILDEEEQLRPGAGGVDPAVFNLADAVILGDIDEEAQSFETSDSGFHVRESTNARLYVSGRSQAMMAPDAVPALRDNIKDVRLTPFEKHVMSFIDGRRPVESIRIQAGLDEVEVKTALATLADKGVIEVVGRALVESDPVIETHPRRRRVRVHKGIAGAVGGHYDETDQAIEEAFRTQTNLAALSDLEPNPEVGAFSSSDDPGFSSTLSIPQVGQDISSNNSENTGLRDNILDDELPSDADSFTVPGLTGEIHNSVLSSQGTASIPGIARAVRVRTASVTPVIDASDGFDDFGGPSEIATALVQGPSGSDSDVFSDERELGAGGGVDSLSLDSATGDISPISVSADTVASLSGADISSMSSIEASRVRSPGHQRGVNPALPTRASPVPDLSTGVASDISFISEENVVRSAIRRADQLGDPEATGMVSSPDPMASEDDDATGVVSAPPSLPPPSEEDEDATGVVSSPPSLPSSLAQRTAMLSDVEVTAAPSASGAWASSDASADNTATEARPPRRPTRRNQPLTSGDRRRQRASALFDDALNDYDQGRIGAARMNAKLACVYDPDNEEYQAALETWENLGSRRSTAPERASQEAPPPEFAVLYEEAHVHEQAGRFKDAIGVLRRAGDLYPNIAAIHNRLGVILALRLKDYEAAVASIRLAIELDPNNLHYRSNLGKIEMRKRRAAS